MADTRLLVIGIDAANSALIQRWAAHGMLPNFASLMQRGRVASVHGVDGFFTGSTWPSLLTAANPAQHGIHYLVQILPGTYRYARPHEAEYIRAPMFWEALTRAGKRVAILDVPLTRLDPGLTGLQTVEWAGHDSIFGFQTTPPELAKEILAVHGRHPVPSDCDRIERTPAGYERFVDTLVRGIDAKLRLTRDLLARGPWDLFVQVFTETHCVGHQCWHLHDPQHPSHDAAYLSLHGDPIRRVYQALDRALGEVIAAAGNPPTLVVIPHGMSGALGSHVLLPEILGRLGLTVAAPQFPARRTAMDLIHAVVRRLPSRLESAAKRIVDRPPRPGSFGLPSLGVDPARSRCFAVPNGLAVSGIRWNLAGREPQGMVEPGEMQETLYCELARDLLEIRDERTGAALVQRVVRTVDLYQGAHLDALPDVLVEWNDSVSSGSTAVGSQELAVVRAHSPKIGSIQAVNDYGRTGEHRSTGMLIAAGPGIEPGEVPPLSILDIAPTITAALGVDLASREGRPVAALIPTAPT